MKKIKVAFAQISYRPAVYIDGCNLLLEPIFSDIGTPHTLVTKMKFAGAEKVRLQIQNDYFAWLRSKIIAILETSIPRSFHKLFKTFHKEYNHSRW